MTGLARLDALASFPLFPFVMQEKRLVGSLYGSGQPSRDVAPSPSVPRRQAQAQLATRTYHLGGVNDALDALAGGEGARDNPLGSGRTGRMKTGRQDEKAFNISTLPLTLSPCLIPCLSHQQHFAAAARALGVLDGGEDFGERVFGVDRGDDPLVAIERIISAVVACWRSGGAERIQSPSQKPRSVGEVKIVRPPSTGIGPPEGLP